MLGLIGGTGLTRMKDLEEIGTHALDTPWGRPSAPIVEGLLEGQRVFFLPRHGDPHRIPPHRINYRANIAALSSLGVTRIVAVNAVGGINLPVEHIVLPDQIIDYTWGRASSYCDDAQNPLVHVDFTWPFDDDLRKGLAHAMDQAGVRWVAGGCYAATQGPRLESAAEVRRMARDGCNVIGMTGMPEAALAREKSIPYAMLCLVVNPAAGSVDRIITMEEIASVVDAGMEGLQRVLVYFCRTCPADA